MKRGKSAVRSHPALTELAEIFVLVFNSKNRSSANTSYPRRRQEKPVPKLAMISEPKFSGVRAMTVRLLAQ